MTRSQIVLDPSLIGRILEDTYRVEFPIGRGGMGAVYGARNLRTDGLFAIKVLHPHAARNADIFARFCNEARITSGLRHPGIVQVIDFFQANDGSAYIVMEYLEGETLEQRLAHVGRLPLEEAVALVSEVGLALHAAHRRGVIHRDVKPSNIFLARHDRGDEFAEQPKLIDFGVCHIRGSTLTPSSAVIGTPLYASPEAAQGLNQAMDGRSDQYPLALILYELLAGRLHRRGGDITEQALSLRTPLPLSLVLDDVPAALSQAVTRALSFYADDRFPTMRDFVQAIGGPISSARTPSLLNLRVALEGEAEGRSLSSGRDSLPIESMATVPGKGPRERRVLVVDDDPDVAGLLRTLLESAGYACRVLPSGEGLMDLVIEFRPDLVLLDICLPGRSGYQLCWQVRSRHQDLPVVLVSGKSGAAEHKLGQAMGASAYVPKPFEVNHLLDLIDSFVAR